MTEAEEFDVGALFPAAKPKRSRPAVNFHRAGAGRVVVAAATGALVVLAARTLVAPPAPWAVVVGAAVTATAGSHGLWRWWGPTWALVALFLMVAVAVAGPMLVLFAPAVVAAVALLTVVVRSVSRNAADGAS